MGRRAENVAAGVLGIRRYPLLILVLAALAGCAPTPVRHQPAAAAAGSALLVLHASARISGSGVGPGPQDRVTDGVLEPIRPRGQARRGVASDGILIFADLPPGRYRLALVNASRQREAMVVQDAFLVPPEMTAQLTFRVAAGEVLYGGSVRIERGPGGAAGRAAFHVSHDKGEELRTWRKLLKLFGDSHWAPAIRRRIAALSSGGR